MPKVNPKKQLNEAPKNQDEAPKKKMKVSYCCAKKRSLFKKIINTFFKAKRLSQ